MDNKKPKYNLWQNSWYMLQAAWTTGNKIVIALCLVSALLFVINNLLGLFIAPQIIAAIEAGAPLAYLLRVILLFSGGLLLVQVATTYVKVNQQSAGRIDVRTKIIGRISDKAGTTSYPNTETQEMRKLLEMAQKSCSSSYSATEDMWNTFSDIIKNLLGFAIFIVLLSSFTPWVLALVLGTTVTGFFFTRYINDWGYRHRSEEARLWQSATYLNKKARDTTLAKDIRLFGMHAWLTDMLNATMSLYQNFYTRGARVYIWADVVDLALSFVRSGVAYIYLVGLLINTDLSASQFLLYFMAISGFTAWVNGILGSFAKLYRESLEINKIREFLEYPEPFQFLDGQGLTPDNSKPYTLALRGLSFRHHGAQADTLKNINLTINAGEKLAIVGLNGAGKTTLVKMLCGLYNPTQGEVLLNGQDIRRYNRQDYYKLFSVVFQEFSVLPTSVKENISQSLFDTDGEKLKAAAQKAGIAKKIEALPGGYDTPVGKAIDANGIDLSGGEMQRLMLARALYKDAPIIVLDEPTAAMDPIAESEIYNQYHELTGGRTSVYISHRLASTRFCDRIIYVENGQILEVGTHEALIKQGGRYAELYEIQSHYYNETGG
ncbi:MAG: ABC transporter ATP-binding protein/permease [Defluviitaleaceae bacterium]|nr:ABC transporter ATP-binding protein/permease [Defluviitaleaceae bacterium]